MQSNLQQSNRKVSVLAYQMYHHHQENTAEANQRNITLMLWRSHIRHDVTSVTGHKVYSASKDLNSNSAVYGIKKHEIL